MKRMVITGVFLASCMACTFAFADITIPMYFTAKNGQGKFIGNIIASDTPSGLMLLPKLIDLTPGPHGFHVHQNPTCDDFGMAAGDHLDPYNTKQHLGPDSKNGHLGDLPVLMVNQKGKATTPVIAPRLNTGLLKGHVLMIHQNGDNYSDIPEENGGGGPRVACGVVP
jgi:Cu-Zn family superoxide dismutase